jgi:phosphoinositide-3-kinase regulatory subunit 4
LGSLAATASKFLDMMQALRADGSLPASNVEADEGALSQSLYQTMYDVARAAIVEQFEAQTKSLLTDPDPAVRRAFLGSVSSLCVFFGSTKASDVVLSHLNTYLNDRDWMLKCAFFETIVGVATYVGSASFEEFILPLMVQALTDPEEFVVERVLRSLSAIAQLGLFQRSKTWELIDIVGRFMVHPNVWIRESAVEFVASVSSFLSAADCEGIVLPMIRVYLKVKTSELSEYAIMDALKKPLSRTVFDMALSWATKVEKGLFWRPAQQQRTFSFGSSEDSRPTTSGRQLTQKAFARVPKNDEDDKWIWRLRNAGMVTEDEVKLLALREYIWRVAHRRLQEDAGLEVSRLNGIMTLTNLKVSPQTVFFDNDEDLYRYVASNATADQPRPQTIAEALQEATMPINGQTESNRGNINQEGREASKSNGLAITSTPMSPSSAQNEPRSPSETGPLRRDPLQLTKSSSKNSSKPLDITEHNYSLRRKGSAMSLIGRTDSGSKALAEISTTTTNAFGQVERTFSRSASGSRTSPNIPPREERRNQLTQRKRHGIHTYAGHDPSVLKLLDSLYLDNYPAHLMDFGPLVAPNSRKQPIQRPGGQSGHYWKPEGQLVAMLGEHTGPISRIAVAPDHVFFITGSGDGSVKVWDTARLEKNVSNRSRQTHKHAPGARITSLCFVEDTHCFVSAGSDGSLNVVKVGVVDGEPPRYQKLQVVREYQLPDEQYAVWSQQYKADNQSLLIVATNKSRILGIELRNMSIMFEFQNPLNYGAVTCFCLDKKHHWMLVSTTHGVLSLWDLRFRIRVRTWAFPHGYPIHRLMLSPGRGSRRNRFAIAGGSGPGEVTLWDLEKLQWKEAYRTGSAKDLKGEYKLIDLDEAPAGGALRRYGSSQEPKSGNDADLCVPAITMGSHYNEDGSEARHFFLLSAGPDWKVRFWDPSRQDASMVVNGLEIDEGKPTYRYSHPGADVTVIQETLHPAPKHSSDERSSVSSPSGKSSPTSPRKASGKHTRSSIISLQQQHLLRSHMDNIEDVALLEYPFGMVVSADRSGVIYVFS